MRYRSKPIEPVEIDAWPVEGIVAAVGQSWSERRFDLLPDEIHGAIVSDAIHVGNDGIMVNGVGFARASDGKMLTRRVDGTFGIEDAARLTALFEPVDE